MTNWIFFSLHLSIFRSFCKGTQGISTNLCLEICLGTFVNLITYQKRRIQNKSIYLCLIIVIIVVFYVWSWVCVYVCVRLCAGARLCMCVCVWLSFENTSFFFQYGYFRNFGRRHQRQFWIKLSSSLWFFWISGLFYFKRIENFLKSKNVLSENASIYIERFIQEKAEIISAWPSSLKQYNLYLLIKMLI